MLLWSTCASSELHEQTPRLIPQQRIAALRKSAEDNCRHVAAVADVRQREQSLAVTQPADGRLQAPHHDVDILTDQWEAVAR